MKRKLIVLCVALLLLTALASLALADGDALKFKMDVQPNRFTGPQEASVGIQVSNSGESDMPGPVTLYDPNDQQIEEFGAPVLTAGSSQSWMGKVQVTQEMLDKGEIAFSIRYPYTNDEGEIKYKHKTFRKPITYDTNKVQVEVNRSITPPTTAGKGQTVTVTYEIVNTGTVDITDVRITENKSISTSPGTIKKVAPGSKESHTFTVKMGTKNLVSQATIIYTADGNKVTVTKEPVTIYYGEIKLKATLTADKTGGMVGDTVKLTLKLENTSKDETYSNITITDPTLGEVFSGLSLDPGETLNEVKEVTLSEDTTYQFTALTRNADDRDVQTSTEQVKILVMEPSEAANLTVKAEADRTTIYETPGTVRFTVFVTNNSAADIENVSIYATGVQLYQFPLILAGETREFTRDIGVSMAGSYQFVARVRNKLNETESFESNIVRIGYARPTAVPTEAPMVTPPAPQKVPVPQVDDLPESYTNLATTLKSVGLGLLVPVAIGALLTLIGLVARIIRGIQSHGALDHLERTVSRDYEQPGEEAKSEKKKKDDDEKKEKKDEEPLGDEDDDTAIVRRRHRRTDDEES
ncbi:MAG: hypothetical protein IKH38_06270 [Clostridia bacterium]|nr:hypothetical protein [Clostridia bacterium]